jgi:hypothetical protein
MGLGGCRKSAQKPRCDGVVINLMVASEVAAGVGVRGKGCGVDAQRYDRELQLSWRLAAVSETGPKIFLPVIEDALECIAHGLGGADHGVPTLQRGCCKCSDRFHHRVTGGRVGDAAQAPPALIVSPAQPRRTGNCRARVVETADLREFFRCVERDSPRTVSEKASAALRSGAIQVRSRAAPCWAYPARKLAPADCRPIRRRPDIL